MRKKFKKLKFVTILTLSILSMIHGVAFAQSYIFWSDIRDKVIRRSNVDGSAIQIILSGITSLGVSVDQTAKKIYWTDIGNFDVIGDETIKRANFDGTGRETLVTSVDGIRHPVDIELDTVRGKMYWTDAGTQAIYRANLDGSLLEMLVDIPFNRNNYGSGPGQNFEFANVWGLTLDNQAMKMYWTDYFGNDIHVADFNGLNIVQIVPEEAGSTLRGIDIDVAGGKIIWVTGDFGQEVMRANKDGSFVETIVSGNLGTDLKSPYEIAIDNNSQFIYWTDMDTGSIQSSNLDGTNVVTILTLEFEKKPGRFEPRNPAALDLFIDPLTPATGPRPDPVPVSTSTLTISKAEFKDKDTGLWKFAGNLQPADSSITIAIEIYDYSAASPQQIVASVATDAAGDWSVKVEGISATSTSIDAVAIASNGTTSQAFQVEIK